MMDAGCGRWLSASVSLATLDEAVSWLDDQVTPMQTRLDLARVVAGQGNPNFPTGGSSLPPGCVVQIDESLVDQLAEVVKNVQSGSLTQEQWLQLEALAGQSPAIAQWAGAELCNQVSATQLAQVVRAASDQYGDDTSWGTWNATYRGPLTYDQWLDLKQKSYNDEVSAVGILMGVATYSKCPPLRGDFAGEVAAVMTGKAPAFTTGQPPSPYSGAISLVLSYGSYNYTFATTVSQTVVDAYRTDETLDNPVQISKNQGAMPVIDPRTGQIWFTDPLPGVLTMLSTNTGAAQIVLNDQDRLAYLLVTHSWSGEALTGLGPSSDEGTALGKAMEVATTAVRNRQTSRQANQSSDGNASGQVSAEIATRVFAILGQSRETADSMPDGLKTSVANITASYMPDVYAVTKDLGARIDDPTSGGYHTEDDYGADGFPAGMPFGALLTQDELGNILEALGRDPSQANRDANIKIITTAWATTDAIVASQKTTELAASGMTRPDQLIAFTNAAAHDASVLGFITNHAVAGEKDAAKAAHDKAVWIGQAIDAVTAIPVLSLPGKAAEWAWKQALDAAGTAVKNQLPDGSFDPSQVADDINKASTRQSLVNWLTALANAPGGLTQQQIDVGLSTGALTLDGQGYHVHTDVRGFTAWEDTAIPTETFESAIATGLGLG